MSFILKYGLFFIIGKIVETVLSKYYYKILNKISDA